MTIVPASPNPIAALTARSQPTPGPAAEAQGAQRPEREPLDVSSGALDEDATEFSSLFAVVATLTALHPPPWTQADVAPSSGLSLGGDFAEALGQQSPAAHDTTRALDPKLQSSSTDGRQRRSPFTPVSMLVAANFPGPVAARPPLVSLGKRLAQANGAQLAAAEARRAASAVDHHPVTAETQETPHGVAQLAAPLAAPLAAATSPFAEVARDVAASPVPADASTAAVQEGQLMITANSNEQIEVSFSTPETGPIWLQVREGQQGIEAHLETRAEATMQILQAALDAIRQRVESIGVELGGLSLGFRQGEQETERAWTPQTNRRAWMDEDGNASHPTPAARGHIASTWRGQLNMLA